MRSATTNTPPVPGPHRAEFACTSHSRARRRERASVRPRVARAVTARVTRSEPGRPAAQPAGGAAALGRPESQSHGRGGDDERGLYTRSDQIKLARAKARALLSRDELDAALGAALAYRRVRAAGAAARTRKPAHCKRGDESAQRYIGRVIG